MIEKISKNIVLVIAGIILAVFTIMSLFYIVTVKNFFENVFINMTTSISLLIYLLIILAFLIVLKILSRKTKINKKIFLAAFIIIYAIISFLWVNNSSLEPVDDSKSVNDIAVSIANGNSQILYNNKYVEKYTHQIGMITLFSIFYKIFGTTNYRLIQYLNIVSNIFTIILIYLITDKLSVKQKTNKIAAFALTLTFIPLILLETYVYGDYLGLVFSLSRNILYIKIQRKK